jgi:hypothetical protein
MVQGGARQARERIQIGRVVTGVERPHCAGVREKGAYGRPLVGGHRRANLEHLAAPPRDEPLLAGFLGDSLELGVRSGLVRSLPEVVGERQPLVLDLKADVVPERGDAACKLLGLGDELEPVIPDVADAFDSDKALGLLARPPADARHEQVAAGQARELRLGRLRHGRELWARDNRSECPVHVEDDGAPVRCLAKRREKLGRHAEQNTVVPWALRSRPAYAGIGLAAGFFSALFGVGGGIIVVPMLVLVAGFAAAEAAATSLTAIGITAFFGMISFGLLGEVSWPDAVVIGLPAMVGTLLGTALQQRVSSRLLIVLFSLLLVGLSIRLFLE